MTNTAKLQVVNSPTNGVGIFVTKSYQKGEFIAYIKGPIVVVRNPIPNDPRIDDNWIGAGKYSWIDTSNSLFRFINHSCNPNVAIRGRRTIYAIKNISLGSEIMMDYSLTDPGPEWGFRCQCGSKNCRGFVTPITNLSKAVFKKKLDYIPKRFKNIYQSVKH